MRNYGFEYLVEKVSTISEMAKPSIYTKMGQSEGDFYNKFNSIYSAVVNKIKAKSGQAAAQRLAIDYIIINLAKDVLGTKIQGSFVGTRTTEYAKNNADRYLEWYKKHKTVKADPKFGPWAQSGYKKEFFLTDIVRKDPEKATSEKVQKNLLNDVNIDKFLEQPGGYDASLNSSTAGFAKRSKEEMFGKELSEILQNQGAALPLLKQINKLMANLRKGKWEEGDVEFEATQSPSMILADKMLDLSTIMGAKAVDSVDKNVSPLAAKVEKESNPKLYFMKNLTKNQINQISSGIEQLIDSKAGVDRDIWRKKAEQVAQKVSPIFGEFMLFLLDNAELEEDRQIDENEIYVGYDSRVLDKVLDSDEKWEIFDQWYHMEKVRREKQNIKQNIEDVGDVGEFNKALDTRLGKGKEDEEGVMGYMTEQVSRDSHLNLHGKYKERGFKKPVNYSHWMSLNGIINE